LLLPLLLVACSQKQKPVDEQEESQEAKRLLQGVWIDEETETAVFQMKGDSVFYADSTSMPARFRVVGDTLYIGSEGRYYIEKQTEHVLWFKSQTGETVKCIKNEDEELGQTFDKSKPQILTLTEVLKRDTVVFYEGERYHLYVAVNPTKYKVSIQTVNEDGLDVTNVYYDNIIHLSIFRGSTQLFSRNFHKKDYVQRVPQRFLEQSVLNNMEYNKIDARGFHFNVSLCVPDEASCYLVDQVVSFQGKLSSQLIEY
jgi:hypothetical protein